MKITKIATCGIHTPKELVHDAPRSNPWHRLARQWCNGNVPIVRIHKRQGPPLSHEHWRASTGCPWQRNLSVADLPGRRGQYEPPIGCAFHVDVSSWLVTMVDSDAVTRHNGTHAIYAEDVVFTQRGRVWTSQ